MRFIVIYILLAAIPLTGIAGNKTDSSWQDYKTGRTSAKKFTALFQVMEEYDLRNNKNGRDSIFDLAIEDLYIRTNDSLLVELYSAYFEWDEEDYTDRVVAYSKNLSDLAKKYADNTWFYYSYYARGKVALFQFDVKAALENATEALYYATLANNDEHKVKAILLLGNCHELNNKKVEAFKKYTDALYLSRKIEHTQLTYTCYQQLASFYFLIYNIRKAKEYTTEQYKILVAQQPIDSTALVKLNITLATYLFDNNEIESGKKLANDVLGYTQRHQYIKLRQRMFSIYRTYLINEGHFKELSDLYMHQYPGELNEIARTNTPLYYRLKAFIAEADNQLDSSAWYYSLAENQLTNGSQDKVYLSNFYKRYGEFLLRRGNITEAEAKLGQAFHYAEGVQYLPYLTEIAHELDSLNYMQGETAEAYKYAKLSLKYARQSELVHQEEELLKLEVENEARERELTAKRDLEATERKHNIQYMGISIVIVFSFILLAIIGSFKVHRVMVKAMGFFSFIFLFEFIIMLADHKIHHITHGEPWKFLAFKICLIAVLLPLHHWLEEKVIHYLVSHKMVDQSKMSAKTFFKNFRHNFFPLKITPPQPKDHPTSHGKPGTIKEKK